MTILAGELNMINEKQSEEIINLTIEISKIITGLMKVL